MIILVLVIVDNIYFHRVSLSSVLSSFVFADVPSISSGAIDFFVNIDVHLGAKKQPLWE